MEYGDRSGHERLMLEALAGGGWDPSFGGGAGAAAYTAHWGLPFVQPGASRRGRGTTLVDAHRRAPAGRVARFQYISLKGFTCTKGKARPSTVVLAAGCGRTIRAAVAAARRGNALPLVIFASPADSSGEASPEGLLWVGDVAPILRESPIGLPGWEPRPPSAGGYRKGQAPPAYIGWERKESSREDSADWCHRERGYVWYPQLKLSLPAAGIVLRPGEVGELPHLVDALPWGEDGWYTLY